MGYLDAAVRAARAAGEVIKANLGTLTESDIDRKQAADFVTRVDRQAEEAIIAIIRRDYPEHAFLAEETSKDKAEGRPRWIIDPLDGTTNFIHSIPLFAVSIALEIEGGLVAGVVYDPVRDELFTSERGRGAFVNGARMKVSARRELADCLIATGFPFRNRDMMPQYLDAFTRVHSRVADLRRAGSAAIDLAYVAAGRYEGFFEIGLAPWDIAAGALMIEEAGGVITDFGGGDGYMETGNIVAGAPHVHPALLGDVRMAFSGHRDR